MTPLRWLNPQKADPLQKADPTQKLDTSQKADPLRGQTPPQRADPPSEGRPYSEAKPPSPDTVNRQVVHILLECILGMQWSGKSLCSHLLVLILDFSGFFFYCRLFNILPRKMFRTKLLRPVVRAESYYMFYYAFRILNRDSCQVCKHNQTVSLVTSRVNSFYKMKSRQ